MSDCECLPRCPFFNDKMANMPGMAAIQKRRYCQGDNTQCARHIVLKALGREKVPPDLFPSDTDRAKAILSGKSTLAHSIDNS